MSTLPSPAPLESTANELLNPPQRRFLDAADRRDQTPTLIGRGTHFAGNLRCLGDLSVAGSGEGEVQVAGVFILSDHAQWRGQVHCQQAVLAGQFDGQLHVASKAEVRASAQISGELHAGQLAIAAGAVITGSIIMGPGASIERYTEKRDG